MGLQKMELGFVLPGEIYANPKRLVGVVLFYFVDV